VIVGCIIGIGLLKGGRNINFKVLGEIGLGWIISPLSSGLLTFFMLFFMKNIFSLDVGYKAGDPASVASHVNNSMMAGQSNVSDIIKYLLLGLFVFGALGIAYYILLENKKRREMQKSETRFWKNMK
jgi:phosphate/sulfate permease